MRISTWIAVLSAIVLVGGFAGLRADDDRREGEGKPIFRAELLRVSELSVPSGSPAGQPLGPAFTNNGTDPLDEGSVEVRDEGRVGIRVRGGAVNQAYSVLFCRFGFGPAGCLAVGAAGALATDGQGNGTAELTFPQPAGSSMSSWAGVFLLTRLVSGTATNEYVSGFRLRPDTNPAQAEVELDGPVTALNGGARTLRVGNLPQDVFTDNATRYRGRLSQFSDLELGMRVHVDARVLPDGRLMAGQIVMQGPPSGAPPRGRARGHDD